MKSIRFARPASLVTAAIVGLSALGGCSGAQNQNQLAPPVKAALEKPDQFILYSLDPGDTRPTDEAQSEGEGSEDYFHGYRCLGKTEVTDQAEQKKLVEALQRGIAENHGTAAACFNPRHGIRVVVGDKTYDLVICFECLSASIFVNGQEADGVLVTKSPQSKFDAALRAAGIELPKPRK